MFHQDLGLIKLVLHVDTRYFENGKKRTSDVQNKILFLDKRQNERVVKSNSLILLLLASVLTLLCVLPLDTARTSCQQNIIVNKICPAANLQVQW